MPWRGEVFDDRSEFDFGLGFSAELERHYGASSSRLFEHGHPVPPEAQPFRFKQHNTPKAEYPDLLLGRFGGNMVMSARMRAEMMAAGLTGVATNPVDPG